MINKLKQEIYKKYGSKLYYTKDCSVLSKDVLSVTGDNLSYTTVRRFFDFLKSESSPSRFTLDVFSRYIGCESWNDFIEKDKLSDFQLSEDVAVIFADKAKRLSSYTYNTIVSQSGLSFDAIINRFSEEKKLQDFINSDYKATAVVAPGKTGKSSMLARWYEKESKSTINDTVFISASFMLNFIKKDFNFERWLCAELGINNILSDFLEYKSKNKGQLIIIVDAIDEITYDAVKLERLFLQLNTFLYNNIDNPLKLIVSVRTSTWTKIVNTVFRNNISPILWSNIGESDISDNLSLLTKLEIQSILDLSINSYSEYHLSVNELDEDLLDLVRNPYFLELYIRRFEHDNVIKYSRGILLLDNYINEKIVHTRFAEEKQDILQQIIILTDYGLKECAVSKKSLKEIIPIHLKSAGDYYFAYEDLLSFGFIVEQVLSNEYGSQSRYVKISNDLVFELLISRFLILHNRGVNYSLLEKIDDDYDSSDLKIKLLENVFKYACISKKTKGLYDFFKLRKSNFENTNLISTIVKCLDHPETYESKLWRHYASDKQAVFYILEKFLGVNFMQKQYKKMLQEFTKYSHTRTSQILSSSLLLLNSVYSLDVKACEYYYKKTLKVKPDSSCSLYATTMWLDSIMLYNHFISKNSNDSIISKIFYYREMVHEKFNDCFVSIDGDFEIYICNALLQMNKYSKVIQLVEYIEGLSAPGNTRLMNNKKILDFYSQYSKNKLGVRVDTDYFINNEEYDKHVKNSSNFIVRIIHKQIKLDIALYTNNIDYAQKMIDDLLKMYSHGGFHLCKIETCLIMADMYDKLGMQTRYNLCMSDASFLCNKHEVSMHMFDRVLG